MNEEKFESGLNHWGGALPFDPDLMDEDNDIIDRFMQLVQSYLVPTGGTMQFSGPTAPAGWLLCDGQAVSRTTYAKLFAVISTIYGPGDGTTTFNVPDMRDRVPLGSNANLGVKGGSDTHTLTAAQLPRTYLNIAYGRISNVGNGGFAIVAKDGMTPSYVDALGSGQAHSIQSKYIALNYIIKF